MEPELDLPQDAYLEVTKKDGDVFLFPITKKTVTIGRDPSCDLRLTDEYVSRKHCQIVFRGDHFTVIDLGSLNKTVVKGKEYIQKNLMTGNVINLGETRLRFVWDDYLRWRREHGLSEEPLDAEEPSEADQPG
jgi:pSer/pThr/pTyr-binding forkhead associated (FHA) protein